MQCRQCSDLLFSAGGFLVSDHGDHVRSPDQPIFLVRTHPVIFHLSLQTKTLPQFDPSVTLG
jgi:hypothetical protein